REARVARAADLYAYACHDLDDAYSLGALRRAELPRGVVATLGALPSDVRRSLIDRTVAASLREGELTLDPDAEAALPDLRAFLYERLYEAPRIARQTAFVRSLIESLWEVASANARRFFAAAHRQLGSPGPDSSDIGRRFADAIASMTDRQALS